MTVMSFAIWYVVTHTWNLFLSFPGLGDEPWIFHFTFIIFSYFSAQLQRFPFEEYALKFIHFADEQKIIVPVNNFILGYKLTFLYH